VLKFCSCGEPNSWASQETNTWKEKYPFEAAECREQKMQNSVAWFFGILSPCWCWFYCFNFYFIFQLKV